MTPERIRNLRKRHGLTQAEFYDRLGLRDVSIQAKRQVISRWELGTRNPGSAALALIEKFAAELKKS